MDRNVNVKTFSFYKILQCLENEFLEFRLHKNYTPNVS